MSTRAYKLIEIKTADEPSFNLSHDERIYNIGTDDDGLFTIQKDDAENLLKEIEAEAKEPTADADELEYLSICLKQIIKDCGDEDFAEYYCY